MKYRTVGTGLDRDFRNDLNDNFEDIDNDIKKVNSDAISRDNDTNERVGNIIAQSGTSDTEVVDARGGSPVLRDRLDDVDEQLAHTETDLEQRGFNIKNFGAKGDGVTDDTEAFNNLVSEAPEGSLVIFPKGVYRGNFTSTKALTLDFKNSIVIPFDDTKPTLEFRGETGNTYNVVGNPVYGHKEIELNSVSGLNVDDIGYMYDEATRPSDGTAEINTELVKIKEINGNKITVYDMVRSNQNTGSVKFVKIHTLKGVNVRNVKPQIANNNTEPAIFLHTCENTLVENVEVTNSIGHAVRHDFCIGSKASNINVIKPRLTGSGEGYGVTFNKSRNCTLRDVYGVGTRHIVDFSSTHNAVAENIIEDDAVGAVVVLAHNGYGGNISVNNVTCVSDEQVVNWSNQGVADLNKQVIRDVTITNINHVVPTIPPNADLSSIYLRMDYSEVVINNVNVTFIKDPTDDIMLGSYAVRLRGNQLGRCEVKNITANQLSALIMSESRTGSTVSQVPLIIHNLTADRVYQAVRLRGEYYPTIDSVFIKDETIDCGVWLEAFANSTPFGLSLGDSIRVGNSPIVKTSGLATIGLRGKPPKQAVRSNEAINVTNGQSIPIQRLIDSGSYLRLIAPVGGDITLSGATPLEAPLWIGQEIKLVINGVGSGSGSRGNVIIPSGTDTFRNFNNTDQTLVSGRIYTLVGYNGQWGLVE